MTTKEFKTIARLLKEVYKELEREAIDSGISLLSPEYDELVNRARLSVLESHGFTLEEYREIKEKITEMSKEEMAAMAEETQSKLEEVSNRYIPTEDDIIRIAEEVAERVSEKVSLKVSESVAKKYIKPPIIQNKIVERIIEKRPIKETIKERVEYNDKSLRKEIKNVEEKVDDIKVLTLEEVNQFFQDNFSDNLKKNINVLGMPDFRKLAMGLQQQIDDISIGVISGTWGSIVGTITDQLDLTTALGLKADSSSLSNYALVGQTFYIGTTQVAINRASAALTLAGLTLTTPEIGAATGTSLDLGGTTKLESRLLTVDTGGVFNIAIGSAAGDDFTVDTDKLVVEGDTGYVGIGTITPSQLLTVAGNIALSTGGYLYGDTTAVFLNLNSGVGTTIGYTTGYSVYGSGVINNIVTGSGSYQTWKTNNIERMRITGDGWVGIGTTNPGYKLDVQNAGTNSVALLNLEVTGQSSSRLLRLAGVSQSGIEFINTETGRDDYQLYDNYGNFQLYNITDSRADIQVTGTGNIYLAQTAGNVGIGTTDFDGTPAIGRLVVKGSTNDGSTNILVGRDSDEANVFSVNTNGQILSDSLTASEILITDASKNIVSAAVATYPSLTELAYLKGVTSGIQGQFSDKAATSQTFYIGTTQVAINRASAALTLAGITLTTPDIGTPSAGVLTNCTGLPVGGLANGTDGQLITWGADGVATTVATGDSGQVLTSNGAGAAPTFQAAAGGAATKELWIDIGVGGAGAAYALHPYTSLADDVSYAEAFYGFRVPNDFTSYVANYPKVVVYSNGKSGDVRLSIYAMWAGVGEAISGATDSIAEYTQAIVSNQITEIDISAAFNAATSAGDYVGFKIERDSDDELDTLDGALWILGTVVRYT